MALTLSLYFSESLIELLSITVQSKSYLLMQTEERLATKLQKIIQVQWEKNTVLSEIQMLE